MADASTYAPAVVAAVVVGVAGAAFTTGASSARMACNERISALEANMARIGEEIDDLRVGVIEVVIPALQAAAEARGE